MSIKKYTAKPNKKNKKGKTYIAKPKITKGKKYRLKKGQTLA